MALARRSRRGGLLATAVHRCRADLVFRGRLALAGGAAANLAYGALYGVTAASAALSSSGVVVAAWPASLATYYLVLGCLRALLAVCCLRGDEGAELRWYRRTAWALLALDVPMGGVMVLMVRRDLGFSYPGYLIYLSALYTFTAVGTSVAGLVRYRRVGSPALSAAKVLSAVSAMMSVLGLQTAMIDAFSANGVGYRRMMNAITGGCIYGIVVVIAICMLVRSGRRGRRRRRPRIERKAGSSAQDAAEQAAEQVLCHGRPHGRRVSRLAGEEGLRLHHGEGDLRRRRR